ncbi:hypothetical protein [Sorangium sp. So ce1024]|uniref:hypothetical protein n=1 Tax=Sorangium sp. So ce1024 TaxID=3133327 RepID=UPI003F0873FA
MRIRCAWIVVGLALLGCGGAVTVGADASGAGTGGDAGTGGAGTGDAGTGGDAGGTGGAGAGRAGTRLTLDHDPIALDQPATAHVKLWGYGAYVADAPATAVARFMFDVEALPVELELDIPEEPHTRIDQGFGPVEREEARFYFKVYIDVGRDGQICEEDFVQDYDRSDWMSFAMQPPAEHSIFVEQSGSGSGCYRFDP